MRRVAAGGDRCFFHTAGYNYFVVFAAAAAADEPENFPENFPVNRQGT